MTSSSQASGLLFSSSSSCISSKRNIYAAISVDPKIPRTTRLTIPNKPATHSHYLVEKLNLRSAPIEENATSTTTSLPTAKLYAILEAVADRVEMHNNICEQRDNWNTLLLNSVNMITLTASTMAGVAAVIGKTGAPLLALKLSSALLFSAATGILLIMNKIQPSQLAEEQRNATKLFKKLQTQIQTALALHVSTELDVKHAMEKILALDRAYPLPLFGKMIEKFPAKFEPACWWPKSNDSLIKAKNKNNNWNQELEMEMREVLEVIKRKDSEDYMRLGNLALKVNKILAISGPLLTGIAAVGSSFVGDGSWPAMAVVVAGALATTANTLEHGGQVGMVVEMYRNCAGFFSQLEELIKSTVEESDSERREDGETFEMEMALQLGRSLSELRDLAGTSSSSRKNGTSMEEFASKLF